MLPPTPRVLEDLPLPPVQVRLVLLLLLALAQEHSATEDEIKRIREQTLYETRGWNVARLAQQPQQQVP
jgi:hypothetical protein